MQNPASKAIYIESNDTIEKMSKISYSSLMKWTFPSLLLPQFCNFVANLFKSNSDADVNHLPFPMV